MVILCISGSSYLIIILKFYLNILLTYEVLITSFMDRHTERNSINLNFSVNRLKIDRTTFYVLESFKKLTAEFIQDAFNENRIIEQKLEQ